MAAVLEDDEPPVGTPAAIASAAATEHVRSWRPAGTSTGWLVGPERGHVLRRAGVRVARPRRPYLLAQLDGLEHGELPVDMREEALGRDAAGHDRPGRPAREVDGVLQRDERAERVAEDDVGVEVQRTRERVDVAGVLLERPRLRRVSPTSTSTAATLSAHDPRLPHCA